MCVCCFACMFMQAGNHSRTLCGSTASVEVPCQNSQHGLDSNLQPSCRRHSRVMQHYPNTPPMRPDNPCHVFQTIRVSTESTQQLFDPAWLSSGSSGMCRATEVLWACYPYPDAAPSQIHICLNRSLCAKRWHNGDPHTLQQPHQAYQRRVQSAPEHCMHACEGSCVQELGPAGSTTGRVMGVPCHDCVERS